MAKYKPKANAVEEKRIESYYDHKIALLVFNYFYQRIPAVLFAGGCVELDNPYLAMIENDRYKKEYKKIKD